MQQSEQNTRIISKGDYICLQFVPQMLLHTSKNFYNRVIRYTARQ